ncbi:MAG: DUF4344 domain-containing metallopeptidase [Cyanobacteria bacterium]|nr:DUF4344 domain-containing metallopeptidase [Cyanobacteriota bacterium]
MPRQLLSAVALGIALTLMGCVEASVTTWAEPIEDQGDLWVEYVEPASAEYQAVYEVLQETAFYDDLVEDLNGKLAFPQDIAITFDQCGEDDAWYEAEYVAITLCYELILGYVEAFEATFNYDRDFATEVILAGYHTFLHELGHALVDQYNLPITGREEDAVDSFATIWLLKDGDIEAAIAGLEQFEVDAAAGDLEVWDEHSLNEQRMFNTACLIYGSDPDAYGDWVEDGFLPEERAEQCEFEYEQAAQSWETLLAPFWK